MEQDGEGGNAKVSALRVVGCVLMGIALCALFVAATHHTIEPEVVVQQIGPGLPKLVAPDPAVTSARFSSALVTVGTPADYTGNLAPGVNLHVYQAGSVVGWTVEAWANATTPPPVSGCAHNGVHFAPEDWIFENDWLGNGTGAWVAHIDFGDPIRTGPEGDQCGARFLATGDWTVYVRVEGVADGVPGSPRGLHYDRDGVLREDRWDYENTHLVTVPS